MRNSLPILDANYETVGYFPDGKQVWGSFPENALSEYIDAMQRNDMIKSNAVDQRRLYTNQFVEQFNAFDKDAVAARGRAAK